MVQEGAVRADQHVGIPEAADAGRCAFGETHRDEDPVAPCRLADAYQLGSIYHEGGGGEPLQQLMSPDRGIECCPNWEPGQEGLRKGDQPGAVAGRLFDD